MTTFRELAQRADELRTPAIQVEALVARGEQRLRRRRVGAVVAAAAAVVVMILGGVLVGGSDPRTNGPIDLPGRHEKTPAPTTPKVRQVVYAEGVPGRAVHFGDRVVKTGIAFTHIDVTDDGFAYSTGRGPLAGYRGDGRLWFSDGGTPEQIGSHACEAPHGFANTAVTSTVGSRIAWLECTPEPVQTLVVFDTAAMKEVVRQPLPLCERELGMECSLDELIGDHAFLSDAFSGPHGRLRSRTVMLDIATSTVEEDAQAVAAQRAADVRGKPRGLVLGETPDSGTVTTGIGQPFSAVGGRLVPRIRLSNGEEVLARAFDTATGRPVRLRLPQGYDVRDDRDFELFEWLDDDTVALLSGGSSWNSGDILTCSLSAGRCEVVVPGRGERPTRVVPHLNLPG
jgi:hypothetical protein